MAKKIIKAQMKQRLDTKANWAAQNPVLLAGELGIVSDDPNLYKVGDGTTAWNALPFRGFDGTLVHTTGTSETAAMSQKGTTDSLMPVLDAVKFISARFTFTEKAISDSGTYFDNVNAASTDLIKLVGELKGRMYFYASNKVYRIAFFNAEKKHLSSYYGNGTSGLQDVNITEFPEGAVYMAATTYKPYGADSYFLPSGLSNMPAEVSLLKTQTAELQQSVNDARIEVAHVTGDLGSESKTSEKLRIAVWGDNTPKTEAFLVRLSCDNPPGELFKIYKGTTAHADLEKIYNSVAFGTWLEIYADANKPCLYFYDTDANDETIDARQYVIEYRTLTSLAQDVEELKTRETRAESWKGKTVVCFGDSLTEFKDFDNNKAYPEHIQNLTEATVYNIGIGGTQFRQRTVPKDAPSTASEAYAALDVANMVKACCEQNFSKQIAASTYLTDNNLDSNDAIIALMQTIDWQKVDVVTIMAGTNDWNNAPTEWGEETSEDINRTFGAINEIIKSLMTTYPHVKIYWFTPTVRWLTDENGNRTTETFSDNFKRNDTTLKAFSERVAELVKSHHLPVCDMYNTLGWNQYNFSQFFPDNDGTHPRKGEGTKQIAKKMVAFINANRTF